MLSEKHGAIGNLQISLVSVRGKLHPVRQPIGNVLHERVRIARIPTAAVIGDDQLAIRVQGGPGPKITSVSRRSLGAFPCPIPHGGHFGN